ncbi:HDIG domain-containing protein [Desulfocicer vacuolatum DSM 3385]|uniref:HDIG domain-containing protein n=1 Tax=Desulfocicer vacuolatum DSM 3385 TaxID=1121400 RepID=A0A1W2C2F2_9BACT|nr:HD domain-containing phosphohydrolase [Desulfocicer vacuolatum]SMC79072.1 HDIG domain-containing protein [Desulfocicer vacuolatum DSM 3385]
MMDDGTQTTILVVDDEEGILEITEEYFVRKGYEVFTARNGKEAMAIIDTGIHIGCCFTDINMPVMDGLELAERIRKKDASLPVVVMTGFPSLENSIETLKNGVVDYLIKPVNLEQMELALRRILRERGLFVENLLLREEVKRQERIKALNEELVAKVEEVNLLNKIMDDFSSFNSSHDIFNHVVALSLEVSKADEVSFYIYSESGNILFPMACSNIEQRLGENMEGPFKDLLLTTMVEDDPLLVSTTEHPGLFYGARSFMASPLKIRDKVFGIVTASISHGDAHFTEKDIFLLNFISHKAASAIENTALYENIYDNLFATLYAFVAALEARDPYTQQHSKRVAEVSVMIGRELGCTDEELDVLQFAGHLHDIGKIGIRDDILLKPSRLNDEEYEKIKEHPVIGADIVGQLGLWTKEQDIIRHHHEHYNGNGYPMGARENEIPRLARILSVADAFDAMASDRAYRRKMSKAKVIGIIREESGKQFDPEAVAAFLKISDRAWEGCPGG